MLEPLSWGILEKLQLWSTYSLLNLGSRRGQGTQRASHVSGHVCTHGMTGILGTGSPGKALWGKLLKVVGS